MKPPPTLFLNADNKLLPSFLYRIAVLCLSVTTTVSAIFTQQKEKQDNELQMGQEVFNDLKAKDEIVESSPLYDTLRPIADANTRVAQPRYTHPFKFYLVHEAQPNAFATPGGSIYVVDSLPFFVKNTEQFAGTLCHEVSHTIHHDTMTLMEKQKKIRERAIGGAMILGPTRAHILAIALLAKLHSLAYSRGMEERADLTGSDVCAAAGYNPWGLVWLFQDFKNAQPKELPQLLSDHPNDQHRITALREHFRKNPSVFGVFNSDPGKAQQAKHLCAFCGYFPLHAEIRHEQRQTT